MNIKHMLITSMAAFAIALAVFISPASALTLKQAKTEAGCNSSPCVTVQAGTRDEIIPGAAIVVNGEGIEPSMVSPYEGCQFTYGSVVMVGNQPFCVPGSSVGSNGGGYIAGYQPDTTETVNTQTTVTKEIVKVGPAAPGNGPWDVVTTTETVDVP